MFHRGDKEIAVCCAFRSGTNFIKFLLEENYCCRVVFHAFGRKHGFIPVLSAQSRIKGRSYPGVFVTKDALSHIVSLHKYFTEVGKNISAPTNWGSFLVSPLSNYVEADSGSPEYRFGSPPDHWNALIWNFHSLVAGRIERKLLGALGCEPLGVEGSV